MSKQPKGVSKRKGAFSAGLAIVGRTTADASKVAGESADSQRREASWIAAEKKRGSDSQAGHWH